MKPELTREFIADTLAEPVLDPRTRAVYELCFLHRNLFQDDIVADKLRMIARLCADRGLDLNGFSPEFAAHRLGRAGVDRWFAAIATAERLDPALVSAIHKRVMDVFADLPAEQARALASSYLHYHFPELFYIYDSRALSAATHLADGESGHSADAEHDSDYGHFFASCRRIADRLTLMAGRRLNPRELDRVLRAWADCLDIPEREMACAA